MKWVIAKRAIHSAILLFASRPRRESCRASDRPTSRPAVSWPPALPSRAEAQACRLQQDHPKSARQARAFRRRKGRESSQCKHPYWSPSSALYAVPASAAKRRKRAAAARNEFGAMFETEQVPCYGGSISSETTGNRGSVAGSGRRRSRAASCSKATKATTLPGANRLRSSVPRTRHSCSLVQS